MALAGYEIMPHQYAPAMGSMDVCRDRYGWFNVTFFQLWACSQCYSYLFPDSHDLVTTVSIRAKDLLHSEDIRHSISSEVILYPEMFEGSEVKDKKLCTKLGDHKCGRLSDCCRAAIECCNKQVLLQSTSGSQQLEDHKDGTMCPTTWDGYLCFQETMAGQVAYSTCPSYIDQNNDEGIARKTCTENGTWWKDPLSDKEWTNYTGCISLEAYRIIYYVGTCCNVISIIALVPACIIFLRFKQLRKQHRIRIHLNLFLSFILTCSLWLGWDHVVFRDRMENSEELTVMHIKVELCRFLYIASRYSWTSNFVWMSLEGFHLYRLINHAFKAPKSIMSYYFVGWLFPFIPLCLYSIMRASYLDTSCWVEHASYLEWIMYGPILLCIVLNMAFLVNILRILLTQIRSHPNEPSNYRRALKATFILVPLFGLQLFLVVYRPGEDLTEYFPYEIAAKMVINSQGAAVAVVFCFLNSEVHSQFRSHVTSNQIQHSKNELRSCTYSTEMRRASTRGSNHRLEHIPLTSQYSPCHGAQNGSSYSSRRPSPSLSVKWQPTDHIGHANQGKFV